MCSGRVALTFRQRTQLLIVFKRGKRLKKRQSKVKLSNEERILEFYCSVILNVGVR